ncbi:MAG TPA: glucose-6-phosphate dehydrogenase assembly protein OpcA, partial [Byssovorax sp.]
MSEAGSGAVSDAVTKVEQELAKFWSTPDTSTGVPVLKVRASTMNFVAIAAQADVGAVAEATAELAESRAGRVFVLSLDGRLAPWEVATNVATTCTRSGDDVVCHDRVELGFGAVAAARAASVVSALALSEVPTIVEVGRGAPPQLVDAVLKLADRVVVDGAHTPIARLADIASRAPAPIADRAMVRSFSMRELVARFVDAAPEAANTVGAVTIRRAPGGPSDGAAAVLGWLGSRLGWTWRSRVEAGDASGGTVTITVVDDAREGLSPGDLVGVELTAKVDGEELRCACIREADARTVRWTMTGARTASHARALGFRD